MISARLIGRIRLFFRVYVLDRLRQVPNKLVHLGIECEVDMNITKSDLASIVSGEFYYTPAKVLYLFPNELTYYRGPYSSFFNSLLLMTKSRGQSHQIDYPAVFRAEPGAPKFTSVRPNLITNPDIRTKIVSKSEPVRGYSPVDTTNALAEKLVSEPAVIPPDNFSVVILDQQISLDELAKQEIPSSVRLILVNPKIIQYSHLTNRAQVATRNESIHSLKDKGYVLDTRLSTDLILRKNTRNWLVFYRV